MSFNTVSAILRGQWLIDRDFVSSHLPLIHGIIIGKSSGAELFSGSAENEKPFAYLNGKRYPAYKTQYDQQSGSFVDIFNEELIPQGAVGVIPTIGAVLKYNGDCGEPGMIKRTSWASDYANSSKIESLASWIDSPGGQADGTPQYADFLKSIDKPKTAFVDGGAYSAGAWIASAHDNIILSNKFAGFGSIGAYTTIVDYRGYFQKQGFKVTSVYPDESSDKNLDYRKAMDGDFSMIKAGVAELALYFREAFSENRSGKLKDNSWNKGGTFKGQEAIDLGLVDGIGNFSDAIAMGTTKKTTIVKPEPKKVNKQSNNSKMDEFGNLSALSGVDNPTQEQIDLANADLTTANITKVTLVEESLITDAANVTAENTRLTGEVTALTTRATNAEAGLATANNSLAAAQSKITDLEAKVEAFGKNAGGKHLSGVGADEQVTDQSDMAAILNALPHNQTADRTLGR